ncbi:sensor histidine kinase [Streptomyces lichenis]|uniref:Signal transduction histidine-protein kinase/phosphatase MprB n=1 Tax=Streptomyces lichenis TaxID=2306967 RepID=A0ABT0I7X5_9ACTN|nr:nitrate- and nitrite sensing domain-containing protein [Streptomyces lichenis]MCK8677412.1 nitrate- and nitrite sensing domain-containing protein [Streptomyces lichenis]
MRASVQKRSETPGDPHAPGGRRKRVRSRLVIGVALTGLTVLAAGAPMLLTASQDLNDSQSLVTRAELNRQAVTLAHSLADERDDMTAYVAAGREKAPEGETGAAPAVDSALSARVDRQIAEIREAAPADLRRELSQVPDIRRTARTGTDTAMAAHRAYTKVVGRLLTLSTELADRVPARAADAGSGARALTELGQATDQASATRGLLLAALAVPGAGGSDGGRTVYDPATGTFVPAPDPADETAERTRNELTAAAQQSRVREQAALGDFGQTAPAAARDSLSATVTGPEVKAAEDALARLTDRPELSDSEQGTDPEGLAASLTARIEQMRGAESALATDEIARMERLRDEDVTGLELRIGVLGALLLLAIAISTAVARSLTRPLSVLRRGAARLAEAPAPQTEEPVRFTGRNDEFAQVVRSLNTLHGKLAVLADRASAAPAPASPSAPAPAPASEVRDGAARAARKRAEAAERERDALAAELAAHRAEAAGHTAELASLTAELTRLRDTAEHTFVNLSLRTLGLVERQLGVIEKLEEREQDPDRLATLFRLDHLATVMRRHSENLLVLAGHEHHHAHQGPVPLVDVARAAVSEIERYERVVLQSLPPHAHVAGFAADDLSHLLAELLENATSFSPPDAKVQLSGWLLESGEVMLSVEDTGIGVPPERLAELNACLADPATPTEIAADADGDSGTGLGMRVTALLAARHGVRVELRAQQQGGLTAVTVLPPTLLAEAPPAELPPSVTADPSAPALAQPGSVAEANSHTLPGARPRPEAGTPGVDGGHEARGARGVTEEPAADHQPAVTPVTAEPPESNGSNETDEANEVDETGEAAEATAPDQADEPAEPVETADAPQSAAAPDDAGRAETTLQVRLPRPATGAPDEAHARADEAPGAAAAPEDALAVDPVDEDEHHRPHEPKWERVTDKGLPKRTPRAVPQSAPPAGRTGGVDAEALRRRLGGFQQGARDGRRDAEAEIAGERITEAVAGQAAPAARERTVHTEETGDTVEEARG